MPLGETLRYIGTKHLMIIHSRLFDSESESENERQSAEKETLPATSTKRLQGGKVQKKARLSPRISSQTDGKSQRQLNDGTMLPGCEVMNE